MLTTATAMPRHDRHPLLRVITFVFVIAAMVITAAPSASAATTCERVFTGNATGARDVTASLTAFLDKHGGKHLCLKPDGLYRVDGTVRIVNEYGLRLNGRNATLRGRSYAPESAHRSQLRIESGQNMIIRNLNIRGNNPDYARWNGGREHEHGVAIFGGRAIKLINIRVRDTYGDGIYVGYVSGRIAPANTVTLDRVSIARTGRSGVAIVGGNYLRITRAVISDTGLHSVNLEPDATDAAIHHVTVEESSLQRYGRSDKWNGYAFNAYSWVGSMSDIRVAANRAYRFASSFQGQASDIYRSVIFTGNVSSVAATATFANVVGLTFSGNVRITAHRENVR